MWLLVMCLRMHMASRIGFYQLAFEDIYFSICVQASRLSDRYTYLGPQGRFQYQSLKRLLPEHLRGLPLGKVLAQVLSSKRSLLRSQLDANVSSMPRKPKTQITCSHRIINGYWYQVSQLYLDHRPPSHIFQLNPYLLRRVLHRRH